MLNEKPKVGDILWGVWEHRYYNEKHLIELEYVVYPVKITHFFTGSYVDAHCVGIDTDGHTAVHWIAVKNIGKTAFTNPIDAAKRAEIMSNFYDKHYTFDGKPIRRTVDACLFQIHNDCVSFCHFKPAFSLVLSTSMLCRMKELEPFS